jgi:hypothetical protein
VSENSPIVRLFHHVSSGSDTTFVIVRISEGKPKEVARLTEGQLRSLAVKSKLSTTLKSALKLS